MGAALVASPEVDGGFERLRARPPAPPRLAITLFGVAPTARDGMVALALAAAGLVAAAFGLL